MKKLLLALSALLFTTFTFSQYNLEFSKAISKNIAAGASFSVPEGKVWKIQDWKVGSPDSGGDPGVIRISSPNGEHTTYQGQWNGMNNKPLWVPALYSVSSQGGTNAISVNILEFSLVSVSSSGGGSGDSGSGGSGSSSTVGTDFSDNAGVPGDDFTDQDGNTYGTTNINGMIWTTSNYKGSTYSDGTPIPYISDWQQWKDATTGAYTYWVQDSSLGYGKIYNLHAIRGRHDDVESTPNKTFAPEGWHLPSNPEMVYINALYDGNNDVNSYALKSQTSWFSGANGTNISGLDIKPWPGLTYTSSENYGFTSTSDMTFTNSYIYNVGGSTYFASSTPHVSNPLRMNMSFFMEISGGSAGAAQFSYTPYLAGIGNNTNNYFNDGHYVRLIKDY